MSVKLSRVMCAALEQGADGAPPTEFRIFRAGVNDTTKGAFTFDAQAAAAVLAEYQRCGVDLMIDLNHESLDDARREDSGDARGWFKLELRDDGSLWAVDVKWTPDGARRLSEKTQRYISPAFCTDDEGVIRELLNVALVAMPATHNALPLVAARKAGLVAEQSSACKTLIALLMKHYGKMPKKVRNA